MQLNGIIDQPMNSSYKKQRPSLLYSLKQKIFEVSLTEKFQTQEVSLIDCIVMQNLIRQRRR